MEILIILALVIAVILIVGYPLVNPKLAHEQAAPLGSNLNDDDLYEKREVAFEALRDLHFEYATGKLSSSDYEQLKAHYELQAAEIMQQIDAQKPNKRKKETRTCPRCSAAMTTQDKFCTKCGVKL